MTAKPMLISMDFRDVPPDQATVPVLDHGFLFGDSVYEVVRTWKGRLLFAREHMARLHWSADGIRLPVPHGDDQYLAEMRRLHAMGGQGESYIRLIITRGVGDLELATASCNQQRSIMIWRPLHVWDRSLYEQGGKLALVSVVRNSRRSTNPAFKTGNYLNNVLAIDEAKARGATEALMLNSQGQVTEGTTSNIFIIKDGIVRTPRLDVGILSGITRMKVMEACRGLGVRCEETAFGERELRTADEVFITSTTRDVLPITRLDDDPIGDGKPGPVSRRLFEAYQALCDAAAAAG